MTNDNDNDTELSHAIDMSDTADIHVTCVTPKWFLSTCV